ncbi:hypothetical protein Vadar_004430 [Vaccinium darrowii]|uniref:Uncharacterized protein n=1 Tax=Vaccinium darrowii TaxID=229202 RepID=A0ACB7WXP6_9ERIC|nr:hypothetical protein Vadar_004430 [Vaccinium darrowii]
MTKSSRKYVQPGCLSQKKTRILDQRQKTMDRNAAIFSSLGLKDLANGLFGSNLSAKKKSSKPEKSKMACTNDDDEYQPVEEEEGMSSSSEGVASSRLQGNKVCRAPRKKKGGYATHISRDSQPRWINTSIPAGETQVVPRQASTPLVDHVQNILEVDHAQNIPEAATQPTEIGTSSIQPHQLPSPAPTSLVVKKGVRGPTRGKNMDKVRKELGKPIPVEIDRVSRKLVGEHSTAVAAALGEQIRDHAPVRDIRWKAIDFGIRESIIVRVGQTFDIGDYKNDIEVKETIDLKCQDLYKEWKSNLYSHYLAMKKKVANPKNHALYPCKPEDWISMIDNVWETEEWKAKSDRGKYARSKVKFNHTSGSRSFASRASMILKKKGKKQNIAEKFEMTHKRHRHGGEWINDKAKERHAQLEAKLKEQSEPDITNPLSEEQISIDVLGKRSVYVKEYGSRRSTISSSKPPEETLTKNSRTLAKYSRTMTVVQGLLQVLAAKAGIDPAEVQELIDGSNVVEGTSGEEDDAAGTSDDEDDAAGTSDEEDDATSTG